jgi:hypothetical protein
MLIFRPLYLDISKLSKFFETMWKINLQIASVVQYRNFELMCTTTITGFIPIEIIQSYRHLGFCFQKNPTQLYSKASCDDFIPSLLPNFQKTRRHELIDPLKIIKN